VANRLPKDDPPRPPHTIGEAVDRELRGRVGRLLEQLAPTELEHKIAGDLSVLIFNRAIGNYFATPNPTRAAIVPAALAACSVRGEKWAENFEDEGTSPFARWGTASLGPNGEPPPPNTPRNYAHHDNLSRLFQEAIRAKPLPTRINIGPDFSLLQTLVTPARWAFAFVRGGESPAAGVALRTTPAPELDADAIREAERLSGRTLPATTILQTLATVPPSRGVVAYASMAGFSDVPLGTAAFNYLAAVLNFYPQRDAQREQLLQSTDTAVWDLLAVVSLGDADRAAIQSVASGLFPFATRHFARMAMGRPDVRGRVVSIAFGIAFANADAWVKEGCPRPSTPPPPEP
jgi:hypothetical protein